MDAGTDSQEVQKLAEQRAEPVCQRVPGRGRAGAAWRAVVTLVFLAVLAVGSRASGQANLQESAESLYRQALQLKESAQYGAALRSVEEALRLVPRDRRCLFLAADLCTQWKEYGQAAHYFGQLTRYYPRIPQNYAYAGFNAYGDRDYLLAGRHLRAALRWSPRGIGTTEHAQAVRFLADITTGRTYRLVWELRTVPKLLEDGKLRIPLPSTGLPYQQRHSYELAGAKGSILMREGSNDVLLAEPEDGRPLTLTATVKAYSYRSQFGRAAGEASSGTSGGAFPGGAIASRLPSCQPGLQDAVPLGPASASDDSCVSPSSTSTSASSCEAVTRSAPASWKSILSEGLFTPRSSRLT
jgi:hypothetical protein